MFAGQLKQAKIDREGKRVRQMGTVWEEGEKTKLTAALRQLQAT